MTTTHYFIMPSRKSSNSAPMRLPIPSRTKRRSTQSGRGALTTIYKFAKDQVAKPLLQRYSGPSGMRKLVSDVASMKAIVNTEDKHIDILAAAQQVSQTTSLIYGIGTMAQGTAVNQRIGDSIKINRIDLNLLFSFASGTATTILDQQFRWFLVRYLKTPAASGTSAFNISEFLNEDVNSDYTPLSLPNTDTNENFQVMAQGQVDLTLNVLSSVSSVATKSLSISHECAFHQDYSGAANTTITDNMVFLVFIASQGGNAGGSSSVTIGSRMWYIDN
jgi:hypothetical protein